MSAKNEASLAQPLGLLLDIPAAAAYLGLKEPQFRRCVVARRVRVLRVGRKIRVYERWLDEFRDRYTTEPDGDIRGVAPDIEQRPDFAPLILCDVKPKVRQIRVRSRQRRTG